MDGLEAVEIKYSDLQKLKTMRIDNEYFSKCYIENEALLQKFGYRSIGKIVGTITDFGAYSQTNFIELQEQGVNFFRNQDVKNNTIDNSGCAKISNEVYNKLTLKLQMNDILIPRTGTLGNACVISENHLPASANQNLAVLRDIQTMLPHYVAVVLCSKVGLLQINRNSTGNVQQWLNLDAIKGIKIPTATEKFQKEIQAIIKNSEKLLDESKNIYNCAEQLLTDYLKFIVKKKTWKNSSVKMFGDSFNITGRLDAEYYHPKYDALFDLLSKHTTAPLGGTQGLVSIKKSIEPGSEAYLEEGIPFIRVCDVDKHEISTPPIMLSNDIVPNIEDLYPKKDTILLSKDGSIGIAYKLEKDMKVVTSGALLHLTVKDSNVVIPDYLTLVLNSPIVQLQAERDCNGAVIQHWKPSDIEKVLIPILDTSVQQEIASKVQESFRLRAESKRLLDLAVRTVEMAIETNEEEALLWMETQK